MPDISGICGTEIVYVEKYSGRRELCKKIKSAYANKMLKRFMLSDDAAQKLREVYDYVWSDECIRK